jgi:hypothetical protein
MKNEYAKKGKKVWVLTVICPDGYVENSVYGSWESVENAVELCWKEAQPYMIDGPDFGESEKRELMEQKCLRICEDRYVLKMCEIG